MDDSEKPRYQGWLSKRLVALPVYACGSASLLLFCIPLYPYQCLEEPEKLATKLVYEPKIIPQTNFRSRTPRKRRLSSNLKSPFLVACSSFYLYILCYSDS